MSLPSTRKVEHDDATFRKDEHPYIPDVDMSDILDEFAEYLAAALANTVIKNARDPIGIAYFNLVAAKNWDNEDWEELFDFAAQTTDHEIAGNSRGRNQPDPRDVIDRVVKLVVQYHGGYLLDRVFGRDLAKEFDRRDEDAILDDADRYEQITKKLDREIAHARDILDGNDRGRDDRRDDRRDSRRDDRVRSDRSRDSGRSTHYRADTSRRDSDREASEGARFSRPGDKRSEDRRSGATSNGQPITIGNGNNGTTQQSVVFKPNKLQLYQLAHDPKTHYIIVEVDRDGNTTETAQEKDVNYDEHVGASDMSIRQTAARLLNASKAMASSPEVQTQPAPEQMSKVSAVAEPGLKYYTSIEEAWLAMSIERQKLLTKNGLPTIYRQRVVILNPVVGDQNMAQELIRMSRLTTWEAVRDYLRANAPLWPAAFTSAVERALRKAFNDVLLYNLGITLEIDNFLEDLDTVLDILTKKYNKVVTSVLNANAPRDVSTALSAPADETQLDLKRAALEASCEVLPEQNVEITFIPQHMTLTLLDAKADAIDLDMSNRIGKIITAELTPLVHSAATELMNNTPDLPTVHRHLMRTTDAETIVVTNGYMVDKSILASKY